MHENFHYDATFSDILVVGQTGCGKASLVQSLGDNKLFRNDLVKLEWVSKTSLPNS